jgi:diguanylate cyclase (GGDEF)-like protein
MQPAPRKVRPIGIYVAIVTVAASAVVVWSILSAGNANFRSDTAFWLFLAATVFGELRPIRSPIGQAGLEITVSTTFAFAILLTSGLMPALITLSLATLLADLLARKTWWKVLFNLSQYILTVAVAAAALHVISDIPRSGGAVVFSHPRDFLSVIGATIAFFVINSTMTGVALALAHRLPILDVLRDDITFQAASNVALLGLAPVVVVAADRSVWLLPALLMPLVVAYKAALVSVEKEQQRTHDSLTGLPNRSLFQELATTAIRLAGANDRCVGLILIDLDRFKEINDTLSHNVGDLLLQRLGPRLQAAVRDGDTVARLGGDEFGIVLTDLPDGTAALELAHRVHEALHEPVDIGDMVLDVDGGVGLAVYPDDGSDVEVLMQRADVAMYAAKDAHLGVAAYRAEQDRHSPAKLAMVGDLRRAIDQGELVVYYQPKLFIKTGSVVAAEALVRWEAPGLGLVSPDEFIPVAEQTGLIHPLTEFVMTQSLRDCRGWARLGWDIPVAVNISTRLLYRDDFPEVIRGLLESAGMDPRLLHLEITESMIMDDPDKSYRVLSELRGLGVEISIDDFGTGHSSLAYIGRLPVNELKIDKTFVLGMRQRRSDRVIVESTVDLGRRLGLRVVAEGVEDQWTWDELARMGCDVSQGYFPTRPLPPDEFIAWLAKPASLDQHDEADRTDRTDTIATMSQVTTLDQAIETAPADLDASSTATSASQHVAPGVPR